MATYLGYDAVALERQMQTTLAEHIREVEQASLRNFQFGALLQANGRVSLNNGGNGYDWQVEYRRHNVEGNTGQSPRQFAQRNLWKLAALAYRGYQATDMIYQREIEANKTPEGVVKVFDGMVDRLTTSIEQFVANQYFINGDSAQNAEAWQGLETLFPTNGTLNISTGAQRAASQADLVAYPSTTYATLNTVLGTYGGDQSSADTWPRALADPEYDFWTPLIVLWNSTAFSGTSQTFKLQGEEAMRFAIIHSQRNGSLSETLTNFFLDRELYRDLLGNQDNRQEIMVQTKQSLRALGFTSISFDGIEVSHESSVPAGVGYGIALKNCELKGMQDRLLVPEGPEYDMRTQAHLAVVSTLSNLKFKSPRNFVKLAAHDNI